MVRTIKNIALFLLTFAVTFFILDLYIKYAGISQLLIYKYDKYIGRAFINNAEYMMATEGFAMGNINAYGYIGTGYPENRASGNLRIALLGDSYIEGFQLFDRNHFRSVIENDLKNDFNVGAEVLNFGRFGYNLPDMYSLDNNFVSKFKPDITLFFISLEDLSDTSAKPLMPRTIVENGSPEILYPDTPEKKKVWFLDRNELSMVSPTAMMIRNCMTLVGKGETGPILLGKFWNSQNMNDTLWNTGENVNEQVIKPISPLILKIIEVLAKDPGNVIVYRDSVPLPPFLKEKILKTGINFVSLTEILQNGKTNGTNLYFKDKNGNDGHWNISAHKLIGDFLALYISENLPPKHSNTK